MVNPNQDKDGNVLVPDSQQMQNILDMSLIISQKHGQPCMEMRRVVTDIQWIKTLASCAWHDSPVAVYPRFSNKIKSIGSLMEKGILYRGNDGLYYFNI